MIINHYHKGLKLKKRETPRHRRVRMKYGIVGDEYEKLLNAQDHKCAICGKPFDDHSKSLRPHVDHDHITGEVRGVLCFKCNIGIGQFGDDPTLVQRALNYLTKSGIIPAKDGSLLK